MLNGVPVAIKDDADVAGLDTCHGTATSRGRAVVDADVVARLRAAGAVVVGKTHIPELSMSPATDTTTYGSVRNPWDLRRTPGGSSGGSGAAAADGLCGVALGSDGAGSIRGPAAWCGLFGIKPTRDRVPMTPDAADGWQGMAHRGPLARTVLDAALFLDATVDDAPLEDGGFAAAVRAADPGRLRIAVSTKVPVGVVAPLGREEREALRGTAQRLRALGHDVVERDPDFPPSFWAAAYTRVLRGIADQARDELDDPAVLEPRSRNVAAIGARIPDAAVRWARGAEDGIARRIEALWDDVDVLLTPSCADGPYTAGTFTQHGTAWWLAFAARRIPYFAPYNLTGQPAASVPAGFDDDGLPLGVQLVGRPRDEATVLALAAQLEQTHPWAQRRPGGRA